MTINKILFIFFILFFMTSCNQEKEKRNYENIKKIQKGMSLNQVTEIMGNPDYIYNSLPAPMLADFDSIFIYNYRSTIGASGNIQVWFEKNDSTVYTTYDGS